jgi:hypothetical protein
MIKQEKVFTLKAPAEKVCASMRSPELINESEKSRGALNVQVTDRENNDTRHQYEIKFDQYKRGLKGIDKSKTETMRTEVDWDLTKPEGRWVFHHPEYGKRVNVTGGYSVKAKGNDAELTMFVQIEVKLPVVGKLIEKKVEEGFLSEWPKYIARLEKFAQEH